MKSAGVIGSGIGGLASAIRLANLGYKVSVFEANNYVGGKLTEIRKNGFRFDAGPSLFTLPELLDELFDLCNEPKPYEYRKVDVISKYFFEDRKELLAYGNPHQCADEFQRVLGEPKENVLKHFAKAKAQYESTKDIFLFNSMHQLDTFLRADLLNILPGLRKLDPMRTMHQANQSRFKTDHAVKFFDRYATYNGSDPHRAPATLNLIAHLEHNIGAYFMEGGMHQITIALKALADKLSVSFHMNEAVEEIIIQQDVVKGLKSKKDFYNFDLVVSNMDVYYTYRKLMPLQKAPAKILNQPKSSSALIFYWGIHELFDQLELHNIFFSGDYKSEFSAIQEGKVHNDPTVYVYVSSKECPSDAPAGKENWFVMINVPPNQGQNWEEIIERSRKNIIQKLSKALDRDIAHLIDEQSVLEPRLIELKTSSHQGALYGASSNNMFAAFLRHPNFSRKIKNLYFAGGSVHPGGGIPLCLSSAKIIEGLVKKQK